MNNHHDSYKLQCIQQYLFLFSTSTRQECNTVYDDVCQTVSESVCTTEYSQECSTVYDTEYEQQCNTVNEQQCSTVTEQGKPVIKFSYVTLTLSC